MRDNRQLAIRRAAWGGLFAALATLAYYLAYALVVWRTVRGDFSIGDLAFLTGSFLRLRSLLEGLLLGFSQIAGQALYLDDLFSFFEIQPTITSRPKALPFPRPLRSGITFENVGFRYPDSEQWAVRHLNLTIRAGEVVALVGENGAGKTTIVKLLARLYDPTEGRILLDGRDLRDYDLADLQTRDRRDLPGLRPLPLHGGREYRRRAASKRRTIAAASAPRRSAASRTGDRPPAAGLRPAAGKALQRRRATSPAASGRRSRSRAPICARPTC